MIMRVAKISVVFISFVLLFILAFVLFRQADKRSATVEWRRFCDSNTNLFAQVAQACNELLMSLRNSTNEEIILSSSDSRIPTTIRNIKPNFVSVDSNGVIIEMPELHGRGFGIFWQQQASNVWTLEASSEFGEKKQLWKGKN